MNAPAMIDATLHNIALEQEALGAVLISNSALDAIEREISAADFFEHLHGEIFEAFQRVRDASGTITPSLVIAAIGGDAGQIIVDGMTRGQYIARLAAAGCIPGHVKAYAKQIREFANRRKILAMAETMALGIQNNQPAADIAGVGIELLDDIATQASPGSTPQVSIREADGEALTMMQYGMQNPGKLAGISWGLKGLDTKTSGLECGKLYILAGRPGMGKSALGVSISNATAAAGVPTLFFSIEMGAVDLSRRGLAEIIYDQRRPLPYTKIARAVMPAIESMKLARHRPH